MEQIAIKRGAAATATLKVSIKPGYHANTNTPADEYLIPMKMTFVPGPVEFTGATFPKGKDEKYDFSPAPLNVYSGEIELPVHFKAAADAKKGMGAMTGKLRFQACNSTMCLPPRTIEVPVPVFVNE